MGAKVTGWGERLEVIYFPFFFDCCIFFILEPVS